MSGSISATTPAPGASTGGGTRLSSDLNTFLRLLTTQLRNQDPTQPMDANQLTQQLVQFSTVEQQVQTNTRLRELIELQQAGQLGEAATLVGRRVAVESDRLPLQSGAAEISLPAAGRARTARVEVRDTAGNVIRGEEVRLGTEATRWRWDGLDARGARRPDGEYRIAVQGRAADGTATPLPFSVLGTVTGAGREEGQLLLRMGSTRIGYERLRELPGAS